MNTIGHTQQDGQHENMIANPQQATIWLTSLPVCELQLFNSTEQFSLIHEQIYRLRHVLGGMYACCRSLMHACC